MRNVNVLVERIQQLADQPKLREIMGNHALQKVQSIGGWNDYGTLAMKIYNEVISK